MMPDVAFVDGGEISSLTPQHLDISAHHPIRLTIEVIPNPPCGGVSISGGGFGSYDPDIALRLTTDP
jgi:predicted transcriptional regulator